MKDFSLPWALYGLTCLAVSLGVLFTGHGRDVHAWTTLGYPAVGVAAVLLFLQTRKQPK